jgi:hypothetical protein
MSALLARSRFAFMTPGLGNIYEAAATGVPVCWLPPANGSQGKQIRLLVNDRIADVAVTWNELGLPADYDISQSALMDVLADNAHLLVGADVSSDLRKSIMRAADALTSGRGMGDGELLVRFGSNVAAAASGWLNGLAPGRKRAA